jgi:hypothetical protein
MVAVYKPEMRHFHLIIGHHHLHLFQVRVHLKQALVALN